MSMAAEPRSQVSEDESESLELGQPSAVLLPRNSRKNRGGRRKSAFWVYFNLDNRAGKARSDATCISCKVCLRNAQPMKDLVPHLMHCKKSDPLVRARAAKEYQQQHDKRLYRRRVLKRIVLEPHSDDDDENLELFTEFVPAPAISTERFHQLIARMFSECLLSFSSRILTSTLRLPPNVASLAVALLLGAICVLSVAIRLFPLVKWGSVIHEYDPHFNYRVAKVLSAHGADELRDWFDDRAWYPLGRAVGPTLYPGLMVAAVAIQRFAEHVLLMPLNIRDACVLVAPIFAAFASLALFALTKEATGKPSTALLASALLALSPAYISRSTAGSFDNEGVAIFLLIATFWLWIRSVRSGSMLDAGADGARVPFVGFNIVLKAETRARTRSFSACKNELPIEQFRRLLVAVLSAVAVLGSLAVVVAMLLGKLQWSGRSLTLLDPSYAAKYIPIIASVGEHQPPSWSAFYLSLGPLLILAPLGLFVCFQRFDEAHVFMVVYSVFLVLLFGHHGATLLTLAPAACFLSGCWRVGAAGQGLDHDAPHAAACERRVSRRQRPATTTEATTTPTPTRRSAKHRKRDDSESSSTSAAALALAAQRRAQQEQQAKDSFWGDLKTHLFRVLRFDGVREDRSKIPDAMGLFLVAVLLLLIVHARHCANVSHKAYSSTSMEIESWNRETGEVVHDDLREAYYWLRMNAPDDAKILSWWDYGYQLSALSNRTDAAWPILQSLEVDYVLVLFGGRVEHSNLGDDLDKMAWIIRIAQGVFPDAVLESEFMVNNQYVFETRNATSAMTSSLLYKMCYHQFLSDAVANETSVEDGASYVGINDPKRSTKIDARGISFKHLEEAFTTESWFVRIYRVKRN
ncbi:hypothetical protein PINS_up023204 [Pythium insidiosum]|nr:hypothetical protein PINS_up023204 [Pythium insidiosum]